MDHLKFFLLFAIICTACGNAEEKVSRKEKSNENETQKMLRAIFRKLEAIEAKQEEKNIKLEEKIAAIEKQLSMEKGMKTDTSVDVKKNVTLNDASDLEERVSDLELGLAAESDLEERVSDLELGLAAESALEERVSDLELGLAAVADDLDELEESQVWQAFYKF